MKISWVQWYTPITTALGREGRDRQIPEALWAKSLAESVSFHFGERPCLSKQKQRATEERKSTSISGLHMHICVNYTNKYIHHTQIHTKLKLDPFGTYKAWRRVKLTKMNGNDIWDKYEVGRAEASEGMRELPRSCDQLVFSSNQEGFIKLVLNYQWFECAPRKCELRTSHLVKGVGSNNRGLGQSLPSQTDCPHYCGNTLLSREQGLKCS